MCVDTKTKEVATYTVDMPGKSYPPLSGDKDGKVEKSMLKAATKKLKASIKPVKVTKVVVTNRMYGLTPQQFMKYAIELDPDTRRPIKKEEENNV